MEAFSACLEDMETWLTESESVLDQRINLADAQQIANLLAALKVLILFLFLWVGFCFFTSLGGDMHSLERLLVFRLVDNVLASKKPKNLVYDSGARW